jgi:hypothetical protein
MIPQIGRASAKRGIDITDEENYSGSKKPCPARYAVMDGNYSQRRTRQLQNRAI